jgi:hypothetical protein
MCTALHTGGSVILVAQGGLVARQAAGAGGAVKQLKPKQQTTNPNPNRGLWDRGFLLLVLCCACGLRFFLGVLVFGLRVCFLGVVFGAAGLFLGCFWAAGVGFGGVGFGAAGLFFGCCFLGCGFVFLVFGLRVRLFFWWAADLGSGWGRRCGPI